MEAASWAYMRRVAVPIRMGSPRRIDSKVFSEGSQWDSSVNLGRKTTPHSAESIFISYCKLCKGWEGSRHTSPNCSRRILQSRHSFSTALVFGVSA